MDLRASPDLVGAAEEHPSRSAEAHQAGVTLVELMIAMLILGIILAAVASALINFSRQSVVNERRVQATAYLSQLHESFQTLDWDLAGLYDTEIAGGFTPEVVASVGDLDVSDLSAPTYEGQPLVVFPECPGGDCFRDPLVPLAVDTSPDPIDGRQFDRVVTIVTWVTDDPDEIGSEPLAKRFITYVDWSVLGRDYTQRFESLRAPTAGEIDEFGPPDILSFEVNPATVQVEPDGSSSTVIDILVRFSRSMLLGSAEVEYPCYEDTPSGPELPDDPCVQELDLKVGTDSEFEGTITLPVDRIWLVGDETPLRLTALEDPASPPITRFADLNFIDAGELISPAIPNVSLNPQQVDVRVQGPNQRLCQTVTVEAVVTDLDSEAGTVSITWPGQEAGTSGAMTFVSGNTWRRSFASGSQSLWGSSGEFSFTITASNPGPDGELAVQQTTAPLNVTPRTSGPGC